LKEVAKPKGEGKRHERQITLHLSKRDRESFVENILNPTPSGNKLRRAMERFQKNERGHKR
jgi:hypothetical protein